MPRKRKSGNEKPERMAKKVVGGKRKPLVKKLTKGFEMKAKPPNALPRPVRGPESCTALKGKGV